MELGAFSISLTVQDIKASKAFYEKLGFEVFTGDASQNWLIMKNGDHAIGLFQGMFERNMLTFNPGWDSSAQELDRFTDVRELQRRRMRTRLDLPALLSWTPTAIRYWSISTSDLWVEARSQESQYVAPRDHMKRNPLDGTHPQRRSLHSECGRLAYPCLRNLIWKTSV
jgi:hypothetical protein